MKELKPYKQGLCQIQGSTLGSGGGTEVGVVG